jgi:riboflavin synthase
MFTGLVAEVGELTAIERSEAGARLVVAAELATELGSGDSVAVSGVCLTATELSPGGFAADVMNQTLELTSLGDLEPGGRVNLEPALRAGDRLGGHIVQGHVDATGEIADVREDGFARRLRVELPGELAKYVVEHGSIALDGVSLTVAGLEDAVVEVSLIPETLERTTLGGLAPGGRVNVEVDQLARYAERLLPPFLNRHGSRPQESTTERRHPECRRERAAGDRLAVRHHRGGDRGDPSRPHGRRLRRGGPRERGRPRHGGAVRHARGGQLHGDPRSRAHLPGPHRRAL